MPQYIEPRPTCKIDDTRLEILRTELSRPELAPTPPANPGFAHTLRRPTAKGSGALPKGIVDEVVAASPTPEGRAPFAAEPEPEVTCEPLAEPQPLVLSEPVVAAVAAPVRSRSRELWFSLAIGAVVFAALLLAGQVL
ncbi:MAG TPA: hypothetical protein VFQ53_03305 [Kofleriaceae bacterium]|nr:hypothetical protein [Kofleriaceae bacterium]